MFTVFLLIFASYCMAGSAIPEIMRLRDGENIPPAVYETYDSRSIGEAIAERVRATRWTLKGYFVHPGEDLSFGKEVAFDFSKKAQLEIYLKQQYVDEALQTGFLNAHQVEHGEKVPGYRANRDRTERIMAGIGLEENLGNDFSSKVAAVRPKSGVLQLDLAADVKLKVDGAGRFGEISAVLKPEVWKRTTYTPFDSMDLLAGANGSHQWKRKIQVRTPNEAKLILPGGERTDYFESQIWGELDIRDVQEWRIPFGTDEGTRRKLISTGIPVSEYEEVVDNGRYARRAVRVLSKGDSNKIARYEKSLRASRRSYQGPKERIVTKEIQLSAKLANSAGTEELLALNRDEGLRLGILFSQADKHEPDALKILAKAIEAEQETLLESIAYRSVSKGLIREPDISSAIEALLKRRISKGGGGNMEGTTARIFNYAAKEDILSASFIAWFGGQLDPASEINLSAWNELKGASQAQHRQIYKRAMEEAPRSQWPDSVRFKALIGLKKNQTFDPKFIKMAKGLIDSQSDLVREAARTYIEASKTNVHSFCASAFGQLSR